MRIPKINLWKYQKSLYNTQKVKRTVSPCKLYKPKSYSKEAEAEQRLQIYLEKQKQFDIEFQEKINNALIDMQAQDISFSMLWLYGIKISKEKIIETLKARKAK